MLNQCSSPVCSCCIWRVALEGCFDTILYMAVFLSKSFEWTYAPGWKAASHMTSLRMLRCCHDTGLMVELTFSSPDNHFFQMFQIFWSGSIKKRELYPSPLQSNPLLQNVSLSWRFCHWTEMASLLLFLTPCNLAKAFVSFVSFICNKLQFIWSLFTM